MFWLQSKYNEKSKLCRLHNHFTFFGKRKLLESKKNYKILQVEPRTYSFAVSLLALL